MESRIENWQNHGMLHEIKESAQADWNTLLSKIEEGRAELRNALASNEDVSFLKFLQLRFGPAADLLLSEYPLELTAISTGSFAALSALLEQVLSW